MRPSHFQEIRLSTERACTAFQPVLTSYNVSSLPIMEKGEQFLRVIEIFAPYVATIKLIYSENNPYLIPSCMLL